MDEESRKELPCRVEGGLVWFGSGPSPHLILIPHIGYMKESRDGRGYPSLVGWQLLAININITCSVGKLTRLEIISISFRESNPICRNTRL